MKPITLLFGGDAAFTYLPEGYVPSYSDVLAPMQDILSSVDFRMLNLESPLAAKGVGTPIGKSGPNLRADPIHVGFLHAFRCDLALLANNHTGDYGDDAVFTTMQTLDENNIPHIGAGKDLAEAYAAYHYEKDGVRISILSVCENEFGLATAHSAGVAGFKLELLARRIREEKAISDHVLIAFHGGCEFNPLPSPMARERYRTLINLGADAVIGGHTHCMQGMEVYEGKPIVYSMGNLYFPASGERSASWYHGYLSLLTIDDNGLTVRPIPYCFSKASDSVTPITDERLDRILAYLEELSCHIDDDEYMARHYAGWCANTGIWHASCLKYEEGYFLPDADAEHIGAFTAMRNILSCEAHNELVRSTLELAYKGRIAEAYTYLDEVKRLQEIPE